MRRRRDQANLRRGAIAIAHDWLWHCGRSLRTVFEQVALSLSGHLRPRPDQALERALRTAFTQLDEELAVVLGDRPTAGPRH